VVRVMLSAPPRPFLPRPKPRPRPRPRRLPERKRPMTVAVGFQCKDGIVLAADREISTPSVKVDGPKAWYHRFPADATHPVLRVGIVGAGDYAFIRYASELIDRSLRLMVDTNGAPTVDDAASVIQDVINHVHHDHLYPVGQALERPTIDLLVGISVAAGVRPCRTSLTAMTKVSDYEAVGIGSDLANFLVKRTKGGRVSTANAVFWASEVLMHAKHYVPGCGGGSDVIILYTGGGGGLVKEARIREHEDFVIAFEEAIQPVFFGGTDPSVTDDEFHGRVDQLSASLKSLRRVEAVRDLAARVQEDVKIGVPVGHVGFTSGAATPLVLAQSVALADPPTQKAPTDDQTGQPPSQE